LSSQGQYQFSCQLADELWPGDISAQEESTASASEELSLEAQIANEMSSLQKSPSEKRFGIAAFPLLYCSSFHEIQLATKQILHVVRFKRLFPPVSPNN
jgi:hypothetical protein